MNAPEMNASWLTEQGRVRAIDGDSVLVEVGVKSACGHCEHGAGCGVSKLGRLVRSHRARGAGSFWWNPCPIQPRAIRSAFASAAKASGLPRWMLRDT